LSTIWTIFFIIAPSREECRRAQLTLINLLHSLGFQANWSKLCGPSQRIKFLGIIFDAIAMQASVLCLCPAARITSDLRKDFGWWLTFCRVFNGQAIPIHYSSLIEHAYTDAFLLGFGAHWRDFWRVGV